MLLLFVSRAKHLFIYGIYVVTVCSILVVLVTITNKDSRRRLSDSFTSIPMISWHDDSILRFNQTSKSRRRLKKSKMNRIRSDIPNGIIYESNHGSRMKIINDTRNSEEHRRIIPRAYKQWPIELDLPCYEPEHDWMKPPNLTAPTKKGILFSKPYKVGSSTSSGVNLRIARNVAKRQNKNYPICRNRVAHGKDFTPGLSMFYNRSVRHSIIWTTVRDPTQRAISAFFHFKVSREDYEPTDINFRRFVVEQEHPVQDYYINAFTTRKRFKRKKEKPYEPIQFINDILSDYNFIAITERMDESMVALMMLLNLKIADILYLSAKRHGGYDDGGGKNGCAIIKPSFLSPTMKTFFESNFWKNIIKYDYVLYAAANRSLDLTIDSLGRDLFNDNLKRFLEAQQLAQRKCILNTTFPCDANGRFHQLNQTDCLWKDSGCGVKCLDDIATELDLW